MEGRQGWIWIVVIVLLALGVWLWVQNRGLRQDLEECRAAKAAAEDSLKVCENDLADKTGELETCQEISEARKAQLEAAGIQPVVAPPPRPIIIVDPDENANGNHFEIDGDPAVSASGWGALEHNSRAFGDVETFKARAFHNGAWREVAPKRFKARFGSGEDEVELVVKKEGGQFKWYLDGEAMVPRDPDPETQWNPSLCQSMVDDSLQVVFDEPDGEKTAKSDYVELKAADTP